MDYATRDNSGGKEMLLKICSFGYVWAVSLALGVALGLALIFNDSVCTRDPFYLSETKQVPDEGYIRHALSSSPTITS
jgi:hypothetical protein